MFLRKDVEALAVFVHGEVKKPTQGQIVDLTADGNNSPDVNVMWNARSESAMILF